MIKETITRSTKSITGCTNNGKISRGGRMFCTHCLSQKGFKIIRRRTYTGDAHLLTYYTCVGCGAKEKQVDYKIVRQYLPMMMINKYKDSFDINLN